MRPEYYGEIERIEREVHELRRSNIQTDTDRANRYLLQVVFSHVKCSELARRGEDRYLETYVNEMSFSDFAEEDQGVAFFRYAYRQFLLGNSYEDTKESLGIKYQSAKAHGYVALVMIITMAAIKCIYECDNPRIVEDYLLAFLPSDVREMFTPNIREEYEAEYRLIFDNHYKKTLEDFDDTNAKSDQIDELTDADSYARHLFGYLINHMDDQDIQRILRDVENTDLSVALKATSDRVRTKIIKNMSPQTAEMIRLDMEYLGPVRMSDVCEAHHKILKRIIILISNGEISEEKYPYMEPFLHDVKIGEYRSLKNSRSRGSANNISAYRKLYLEVCAEEVERAKAGDYLRGENYIIKLVDTIVLNNTFLGYSRIMRNVENNLLGPLVMAMDKTARNILANNMAQCRVEFIREHYSDGEYDYYQCEGARTFLTALETELVLGVNLDMAYMIREFSRLLKTPQWGDDYMLYRFADSARLLELIRKIEQS